MPNALMRALQALIVAFCLSISMVHAQEQPAPDYDAWGKVAVQAEQIVESNQANDARLESIRGEVARWRDQFQGAQGTNSGRINTLKEQIASLGTPAEGATESDDIASRRTELNDELATQQAPGLRAVEAYRRADSIIQQIDQTMRQRQTNALVRQTSSPINPSNWLPALSEAGSVVSQLTHEVQTNWADFGSTPESTRRVALTIGFLLAAAWLMTRGRKIVTGLPQRLTPRVSERSRAAILFGVSLGQILIPWIGVVLATAALYSTELFSDWGRPLLLGIPGAGLALFGGIWLARRMFPENEDAISPPLPLSDGRRRKARLRASMLAGALALHQFLSGALLPLSGFDSGRQITSVPVRLSDASAGVWHFPIILIGAFFLFQLCIVLRGMRANDSNDAPNYRIRIAVLMGIIGRLVALAAPVLAVFGYVTGANAILWATVLTIALIGLLVILQDFSADLYSMAKVGDQSSRDALMPVLVGFILVVVSIPVFSLIWGARGSDLAEAWTRLQQGFSFGGIRLSPMGILTFIIVFVIGYFLTRAVQGAVRTSILPKTRIDSGGQTAVVSIIGYLGVGLAAMMAITSAGIDLTSLAVVAGALSVGIGFGMQQVVSNFVSGIILLVERPIAVGDWIEVGGNQGVVKKMAVRATQIQTFDRTQVIVPNSNLITQPVTNWTRGSLQGRIVVPITVVNGSDHKLVTKILLEIAEDQPTILVNPPPAIMLRNVDVGGQRYEIRAVISDINGGVGVTSDIYHQILERFAEAGIILPGSTRGSMDIYMRESTPPEDVEGEGDTDGAEKSDDPGDALPDSKPGAGLDESPDRIKR